ncbi:hypothetical protein DSO57_1036268 [Entomophthora muscae]|uniref:Uncharacterized protein n=1 Tax=Entomophthora muscae TaxID=34485 RepID=A0ACC2RQ79_9FUNG|nr:hypothetical protein DSO57_1036268 [Entomophthora muscae]
MASMTPKDFKAFMCMLRPSQVCFLNQLLPANSCQLWAQDCDTTVAGLECDTVTHAEEEEGFESIFAETEVPLIWLPCLGFEELQDWSDNIVLETASLPLATPSALLCTRCNSKELPSDYPTIINWFRISHHEETLYVYVKALFDEDNTLTTSAVVGVEQLVGKVDLCLHVTSRDISGFSSQHVACIWELEKPANSELPHTLGLDLQANSPHCFCLAQRLFVQVVKVNNPQLYLPLAAAFAHFMWYPPKTCSSGAAGLVGCCLKHLCELAYQSKKSMNHIFQLAWCQILLALANVCNQISNNKYKLVAPLVPLSAAKCPPSTPSRCSIPHLPTDSAPSAGTPSKNLGNESSSSGSKHCLLV